MSAVGGEAGDRPAPRWRRPPRPSLESEVDALLADAGLRDGAPLVGLHLGAAFGPSKQWPAPAFGRLAAMLARGGYRPVLLGTAADADLARAVSDETGGAPASLVGRDRPELLPALLPRLACLVSGDTGIAHLAAALGVPTVTLFGPTDPARTAPRSDRGRAVAGSAPCAPCFLATCPIDHVCLRGLAPEEVEARVREVAAA